LIAILFAITLLHNICKFCTVVNFFWPALTHCQQKPHVAITLFSCWRQWALGIFFMASSISVVYLE
jgi:hypothetical protein